MATKKTNKGQTGESLMKVGGILGGLGTILEKLTELAEKGEQLSQSGQIHGQAGEKKVQGIFGFKVKVGLGEDQGLEVEPFGNVRKDEKSGQTVVHEIREPMVDIFEEEDHVLVVAEMPGLGEEDIQLDFKEDILTITGSRGDKKYRKEVLLPCSFAPEKMSRTCRNGVLEVKFTK